MDTIRFASSFSKEENVGWQKNFDGRRLQNKITTPETQRNVQKGIEIVGLRYWKEKKRELTLTNFEFSCSLSCKYIISKDKDKIMMLETERIKRESKPLTFATENKERENEWLER